MFFQKVLVTACVVGSDRTCSSKHMFLFLLCHGLVVHSIGGCLLRSGFFLKKLCSLLFLEGSPAMFFVMYFCWTSIPCSVLMKMHEPLLFKKKGEGGKISFIFSFYYFSILERKHGVGGKFTA